LELVLLFIPQPHLDQLLAMVVGLLFHLQQMEILVALEVVEPILVLLEAQVLQDKVMLVVHTHSIGKQVAVEEQVL
jgi:hypothetical protein